MKHLPAAFKYHFPCNFVRNTPLAAHWEAMLNHARRAIYDQILSFM